MVLDAWTGQTPEHADNIAARAVELDTTAALRMAWASLQAVGVAVDDLGPDGTGARGAPARRRDGLTNGVSTGRRESGKPVGR